MVEPLCTRRGPDGTFEIAKLLLSKGAKAGVRNKRESPPSTQFPGNGTMGWPACTASSTALLRTRSTCRKFAKPARACLSFYRTGPSPRSPDDKIRAQSEVALNCILSLSHPFQSHRLCFDVFV